MTMKGAAFMLLVFHILKLGEAAAVAGHCEDNPLGMAALDSDTAAKHARLNSVGGPWCASDDDNTPYLEVDMEKLHVICAIATQGNSKADQWVETYQLQTSTDKITWTNYQERGQVRNFRGNSDRNTTNKQILFEGLVASYVRVLPKVWHVLPCMRIELYGASDESCSSTPIGVADRSAFPDHRMTATSSLEEIYGPQNGRLNAKTCWQPEMKSAKEYLQLDLGGDYFVCAVQTQGNSRPSLMEWTRKFKIKLSSDNILVIPYEEDGRVKIFDGNVNSNEAEKNYFNRLPRAKFIRFQPTEYHRHPSLRVEVYGTSHGCRSSLGIEGGAIDDSQITAPPMNNVALNARLYGNASGCNVSTNAGYLQVDLGSLKTVTGVAIQGDAAIGQIQYGSSQLYWSKMEVDADPNQESSQSVERDKVRASWFPTPIVARYIRVKASSYPLPSGHCLRIDLFGCDSILRPRISLKSQRLAPTKGSFVDVVCKVTSQPYPVIQWWHGNNDVTSLSTGVIHSNDSVNGVSVSTLRVNFTSVGDIAATYDCVPKRQSSRAVECTAFRCIAFYVGHKSETMVTRSAAVSITISTPSITAGLPFSETVISGNQVTLTCIGESNPAPTVEWFKNNGTLPDANIKTSGNFTKTSQLIIKDVKYEDHGNYSCVFSNDRGKDSRKGILIVYVRPKIFLSGPETLILTRGEANVNIRCHGSGYPTPSVKWVKDNKKIPRVPAISSGLITRHAVQEVISGDMTSPLDNVTSRLYLRSAGVTYGEAGNYSCIVTNTITEKPLEKTMEVLIKPEFDRTPQSLIAAEGTSVQFECRASGVPRPSTTWSFSGGALPPHNVDNGNLSINSMLNNASYEGDYTCTAESRAGKITYTVTLTVHVPPQLTMIPANRTEAERGSEVNLTCLASGDPEPVYKWTEVAAGDDGSRLIKSNKQSLILKNVTSADDGAYTCWAANEAGNTSATTTLEVHAFPRILQGPQEVETEVGSQVVLTCIGEAIPTPRVQWIKDNEAVQPTNIKTTGTFEKISSITISNVTSKDGGNYTCLFSNERGQVARTARLVVYVPVSITELPETTKKPLGNEVSFNCSAHGFPVPTISWLKEDKPVSETDRVSITQTVAEETITSSLRFVTVVRTDSGAYSCKVENLVGSSQGKADLTVLEKPDELNVVVAEFTATTARFNWTVSFDGNDPIQIFMVSLTNSSGEKSNFVNNDTFEYKVENLKPDTEYNFSVVATNAHGDSEPARTNLRTEEAVPGPPYGITQRKQGTKYIISWKSPREPHGKMIEYQVDLKVGITTEFDETFWTKGSTTTLEINLEKLNGDKKYHIIVRGKNSKGWGEASKDRVSIETPITDPPTPGTPPKLIEDKRRDTTVLISIPKFSDENGKIIYYRVLVIRIPKGTEAQAPRRSDVKEDILVSFEDAHKSYEPAVYVTFQFKGSEYQKYRRFVVGREDKSDSSQRDRREVKEYYNGPLDPDSEYRIFARAYTGEDTYSDSKEAKVDKVESRVLPKKADDSSSRATIMVTLIAALIAFVVVAIFVIIIVIFWVRRRQTPDDKIVTEDKHLKQSSPRDVRVEHGGGLGKGTNV